MIIDNVLSLDNSIVGDYLKKYNYPWDILSDLNNIIIQVGLTLDKNIFIEKEKNIWIHKSAVIDDSVKILGPCIIDKDATIKFNAIIRENVIIGKSCVIGNSTELKNSILFDECKMPHFNYIGDSILGYKSHFGAGSIASNVKSDNSLINVKIMDNVYSTNRRKLGSIVGDYVEIGCNSVLMPGTLIGKNTTIYPLVIVKGYIMENKIVKSMNEIIDKKNNSINIYIDFDGTLFNSDSFYNEYLDILQNYNITNDQILYAKDNLFNDKNLFNIDVMTDYLIEKYNIDKSILEKINKLYSSRFLYDDVVLSLERLHSEFKNINLLTFGEKNYQNKKIEACDIKKYFNRIIITESNKDTLNIDYKNSVFIDNNNKDLESVYKKNAKLVIRIKRDTDKYSNINIDNEEILEFNNFNEIVDYLIDIKKRIEN